MTIAQNNIQIVFTELFKKVPMSTQKCQLASCPKSQRVQPRPGERVRAPSALVSPMPPCLASPLVLRSDFKQVPTSLNKFRPIWSSLDRLP